MERESVAKGRDGKGTAGGRPECPPACLPCLPQLSAISECQGSEAEGEAVYPSSFFLLTTVLSHTTTPCLVPSRLSHQDKVSSPYHSITSPSLYRVTTISTVIPQRPSPSPHYVIALITTMHHTPAANRETEWWRRPGVAELSAALTILAADPHTSSRCLRATGTVIAALYSIKEMLACGATHRTPSGPEMLKGDPEEEDEGYAI
ncbi:hypothetical protein O3P69_003737 [Scylla paramamosain]|uniref:Uncharacterized protein n=1 Tax=Scylla paramamosain TaxID=85552 RepID=A0AAW0UIK6_SCYPA